MISAESRPDLKVQYINAALQFVHKEFLNIIQSSQSNPNLLYYRDNIKAIDRFLKVN
jgi:hypothetical protein